MLSEASSEKYSQTDVCYFERRGDLKYEMRGCVLRWVTVISLHIIHPCSFLHFFGDSLQDYDCYFASLYPSPMFLHFFFDTFWDWTCYFASLYPPPLLSHAIPSHIGLDMRLLFFPLDHHSLAFLIFNLKYIHSLLFLEIQTYILSIS